MGVIINTWLRIGIANQVIFYFLTSNSCFSQLEESECSSSAQSAEAIFYTFFIYPSQALLESIVLLAVLAYLLGKEKQKIDSISVIGFILSLFLGINALAEKL